MLDLIQQEIFIYSVVFVLTQHLTALLTQFLLLEYSIHSTRVHFYWKLAKREDGLLFIYCCQLDTSDRVWKWPYMAWLLRLYVAYLSVITLKQKCKTAYYLYLIYMICTYILYNRLTMRRILTIFLFVRTILSYAGISKIPNSSHSQTIMWLYDSLSTYLGVTAHCA